MYRVIKAFTDKYTGERYKINTILTLTEKRAKEILAVDKFIEEIVEETNEEAVEETTKKKKRKNK